MIAGVDGCKAGWIAILEDDEGRRRSAVFATFADIVATEARLVVIDVPIGIMTRAPREVDTAARRALGERACCVFSAPYRPMLGARTYHEACAIREGIDGKRCSKQAFEIFRKIAEVDSRMTPELQRRVREGHPEITFATLQGGVAIPHKKRSAAGRSARVAALKPFFPELDALVAARRPSGVECDDLIDAYAMLWTARRVEKGIAQRLTGMTSTSGQRDDRGVVAEMLA